MSEDQLHNIAPASEADEQNPAEVIEQLNAQLSSMAQEQTSLVMADIQHLRELAILNRMADALAQRRSFEQIMADTVTEAAAVVDTRKLWIVEPNTKGHIAAVHTLEGRLTEAWDLPLEATDLFDRIVAEQSHTVLTMPTYDPQKPEGAFLALPIFSAKYVTGVLILYFDDPSKANGSHQNRMLQSMLHQTAIGCENARLFETLSGMVVDVVIAMALAIESRDPYTGGHVLRVTAYSLMLAEKVGIDQQQLTILRLGGLLHDIGKVAVPDAILNKPGRLTNEEFTIMKSHAAVGYDIVKPIPQLACALDVIRHHHERYDGHGYPDKLGGNDIPILARIAAVADTFDAMTSDRPYRKGLGFDVALTEIKKCAGTQFDPDIAALFIEGSDDRFANAVEKMQQWRQADKRPDAIQVIDLLDLNLPRVQ